MSGPSSGVRIVEVAGIGPGPSCAMRLADMGADVVPVDRRPRPGTDTDGPPADVLNRGRRAPGAVRRPPADPGQHSVEVMGELGFGEDRPAGSERPENAA